MAKKQRIVTIGGGSGSFTVLTGLRKYPVDLSAIVSMSDDGGSSGILRRELGVLPPGDIRQCLVALAQADQTLKRLFNYRYDKGDLKGQSFGNLFLATMEKVSGDFNQAIREAGRILRVRGRIFPVTLKSVKLIAILNNNRKVIGENNIYCNTKDLVNLKRLYLKPGAPINPQLKYPIKQADKIVISPGDLYSSIISNFLVKGLAGALAKAKAKVICISNLMIKPGQTDGFTVVDHIQAIEKYLGQGIIDFVIYNQEQPKADWLKKYGQNRKNFVLPGDFTKLPKIKFIGRNLFTSKAYRAKEDDLLGSYRALIRHDSDKLAEVIYKL